MLIFWVLLVHLNTEDKKEELIEAYRIICWTLIVVVALTCFLSSMLIEEKRQLICLRFGVGPVCCHFDDQFQWACENEYLNIIKFHLDSRNDLVIKAINSDKHSAFQYSYLNKKYSAMAALIKYPDFLDADSEEVGCIFEQACFRGETGCVKVLLKDWICILFFCHSHSHSHSHSALCNVYPVSLDRNRR